MASRIDPDRSTVLLHGQVVSRMRLSRAACTCRVTPYAHYLRDDVIPALGIHLGNALQRQIVSIPSRTGKNDFFRGRANQIRDLLRDFSTSSSASQPKLCCATRRFEHVHEVRLIASNTRGSMRVVAWLSMYRHLHISVDLSFFGVRRPIWRRLEGYHECGISSGKSSELFSHVFDDDAVQKPQDRSCMRSAASSLCSGPSGRSTLPP